jgi:hypothetical protein
MRAAARIEVMFVRKLFAIVPPKKIAARRFRAQGIHGNVTADHAEISETPLRTFWHLVLTVKSSKHL